MGTERIRKKEKKAVRGGSSKSAGSGRNRGKFIQCLRVGSRKELKGGKQDEKGQEKRMQSTGRERF